MTSNSDETSLLLSMQCQNMSKHIFVIQNECSSTTCNQLQLASNTAIGTMSSNQQLHHNLDYHVTWQHAQTHTVSSIWSYKKQGKQGQEGKGQSAAHLVRVSLTMSETVPAASCLCVLSAISACTHVMHTSHVYM